MSTSFETASAPPCKKSANNECLAVSGMFNKLQGQPDSYDKKFVFIHSISLNCKLTMDIRSQYKFGRTLGAGTYGIVREAECAGSKYAIKIILKKNVRGNEKMVYDEMVLLQRMKHPHIVRFHDWFESKV